MCVAVRIVVAAATRERRLQLRRAAVSAEWEVVAAVEDADAAVAKVTGLRARVLVLDESASGQDATTIGERLRRLRPPAVLVGVGGIDGAHAVIAADALASLRHTIAEALHATGDHRH